MKFKAMSNDNRKLDVDWDKVNLYVSRWKPDTSFVVEIVKRQPSKSDPMRRYYFAEVLPKFMGKLGYERDETMLFHHQLKVTYFKDNPKLEVSQDKRGMWRNVPAVFAKDSKLAVKVKKQFVDWVVRKAAEYGVYICDPDGE